MPEDVPLAAPGLTVTASPAGQHAWQGGLRRWDVYCAVILAATLIIIGVAEPPRQAALSAAALAAMVPWYVLVGRPVMRGTERPWRAAIYLGGLFVLLLASELSGGIVTLILLALCPQCFMTLPLGWAAAAAAALNCTPLLAGLANGQHGSPLAVTAAVSAGAAAFAIAFGSWIVRIINQSAERASLIEQLESTRAELAAAHRDAGMAAERQRLSAEIHDTLAQGFASLVMLVQAAEASLRTDPDGAGHHLRLAIQTARENLAEARALVAGLSPAQLAGGSLDDALRRVAGQLRSEAGIAADLEITGAARPLATSAEVVLLRVCQEALANVRKHAGASRVGVRLAYQADAVELEVTDDGAGFDPDAVCSGYGLSGMRARVAEAGGELTVRSAPHAGTTVRVRVPA
jgi:signal transduction histidine kinase